MLNFKYILVLVLLFNLGGCVQFFPPPPYAYELWKKKKSSNEERRSIMVECGYPNSLWVGEDATKNDIAKMHLCMEQHGFKYTGRFGTFCKQYPELPACVEAAKKKEMEKKTTKYK